MWVGGGEGVRRGAWDEVVRLPGTQTEMDAVQVRWEGTCVHPRRPLPYVCHCDWTNGLTSVTSPPLLLCWPFLPNSLDSQQFRVKAGHDAAHVSFCSYRSQWVPLVS